MSEVTKACNLTENEIKQLIIWHGYNLNDEGKNISDMNERFERMMYLNKRLKAFSEAPENPPVPMPQTAPEAPKGWGS